MATIKEVAAYANVSIATVSNYLNSSKPVSKDKRLRIREAIKILNYTPNLSARSLKLNQYNDIGVILPSFNDSYYVQIFQGIDWIFKDTEYYLNLAFTYDNPELEEKITEDFVQKQVRGIILVTCRPDAWKYYHKSFKSRDKSIVLIDRQINNLDVCLVSFDYYNAVRVITESMISSGYREIYLFTGPHEYSCEKHCADGFKIAFKNKNLAIDKANIVQNRLNKEDAFRNIISVLKNPKPDAILTTCESCANGIIEGLTFLKHSDSVEIPVITLGEDHWNHYTHSFAAYSAGRPAIRIGKQAAQVIIEQLMTPKTFESQQIVIESITSMRKITTVKEEQKNANKKKSSIKVLLLQTSQSYALQRLLPHFENESGIHVECKMLPHQFFLNRLLEDHSNSDSDNCSDVYTFDIPWLHYLAHSQILADISKYIADNTFDTSIYLKGCLDHFSEYNGKFYGLPFLYAPQILYYRKDLFSNEKICDEYKKHYHTKLKSPSTWTEYNAIAEFFTKYCDEVDFGAAIPASFNEYLMPEIYVRLWSYGGSIIENDQVTFDSPGTLKAFINLINTLKNVKKDYKQADDVSVVKDFLNNKIAMLLTYPSFLTDIEDLRIIEMKDNIGYSHIPGNISILGGWSMGINSHSQKKEEAFRFIRWACTKQTGSYFPLLGGCPAITSVYTNDELIQLYPWLPLCLSAYDYSRPITTHSTSSNVTLRQYEIEAIICKWFFEALNGKTEISDAIKRAHSEIQNLIKS